MRVFILFLVGLTLSAALIDHETKEEFKDFLQKFGKHYDNPVEYAKRLAIYAKNKAERIAHNLKYKNGDVGWEQEVNKFSDETKEEFKKHLGLPPGPPPNNTDDFISASVFFAGQKSKRGLIDWRAQGKVGSVKDQGQCGSCWTFSSSATIETCVALATGSVPDVSEQQFQDCLASKKCSPGGGWPSAAIDYAKNNGQSFERDYGYTKSDGSCHATQKKVHVGQRISGRGEDQLESMLQKGVVSVCLDANVLQSYRSGVIDAGYSNDQNHAVTAVAITTDCNGRAAQCYIVKNSWGTNWGENGYFRIVKGQNSLGIGSQLDLAYSCSSDDGGNNNNNAPYGNINYNQDLPGGDIAYTTANDAKDCQAKCAGRNDCTIFAFDTCGNRCWFKSGNLQVTNNNCRASGIITRRP